MSRFQRNKLPDWPGYADSQNMVLNGRGLWRTTACLFHAGSDSMRVNLQSGGWVCMSCLAKGGDVIAHHMKLHGLDFKDAAIALGAWDEGQPTDKCPDKATTLSARDAMQVVAQELLTCTCVISDVRKGLTPSDLDWHSFIKSAGRIEALAMEYRP